MNANTPQSRFWSKVDKTDTCWLWTGAKIPKGYGRFWDGRRCAYAHRFAYELLVAPIPDGLSIDRLCRVPSCVNPAHLEPVTTRENNLRGVGIAAINIGKTHCPQGHPYSAENTYRYKSGPPYRKCRACDVARHAAARLRKEVGCRTGDSR